VSAKGCESCGAVHLALAGDACPACGTGAASPIEVPSPPPERAVARTVSAEAAAEKLAAWVAPVWFPVDELDPKRLAGRLVAVWWPSWLVDVDAAGIWEAEAGFDYPVESSQEVYGGSGWTTRKVTETRTRWERRTGRLRRRYDNLLVPALGEEPPGTADLAKSEPWTAGDGGAIRLPDRSPEEQWPSALEALRVRAGEECARASGADRVRELFLDVDARGAHWSLLLRPGYTTWYLDEDGQTRVVALDATTGEIRGPRMASVARGRAWALGWFAVGGGLALFGLLLGLAGLVLWFLLPVAAGLVGVGVLVGLVGFWPLLQPAAWNRTQA
jgi:hypothetical protein